MSNRVEGEQLQLVAVDDDDDAAAASASGDGDELWLCGTNSHGELGLGHRRRARVPLRVRVPQRIARIACGSAHSLFVTLDGALFACGANRWGQLGIGSTDNSAVPRRVPLSRAVFDIACGAQHSLCLVDDGAGGHTPTRRGRAQCFAFGSSCHGQLGIGVLDAPVRSPALVSALSNVACRQVACGALHSAVLSDSGSVLTFGWGRVGQLGQKSTALHEQPAVVPLLPPVVKLACGWHHTVALTAQGQVFAWGAGSHGQTASPSRQHRRQARQVPLLERPARAAAEDDDDDDDNAAAADAAHAAGTDGDNDDAAQHASKRLRGSQLFSPAPETLERTLESDPTLELVMSADVACGARHTIVLTTGGDVVAFGGGEDGVLGAGDSVLDECTANGAGPPYPVKAQLADGVRLTRIASGAWHCVGLTSDGAAYSWGYGADYRLGHGATDDVTAPRRIEALANTRIDAVAAGGAHTIFLRKFHAPSAAEKESQAAAAKK